MEMFSKDSVAIFKVKLDFVLEEIMFNALNSEVLCYEIQKLLMPEETEKDS